MEKIAWYPNGEDDFDVELVQVARDNFVNEEIDNVLLNETNVW